MTSRQNHISFFLPLAQLNMVHSRSYRNEISVSIHGYLGVDSGVDRKRVILLVRQCQALGRGDDFQSGDSHQSFVGISVYSYKGQKGFAFSRV